MTFTNNVHEFGQTYISVTRVNLFFDTHDVKEADMKTLCAKEADTKLSIMLFI